ncbi:sensor histidine kinase [Maribellus maritimus]|uniref:sensor histidine kinase n=1 Tax=Maribellus maritimus TaxID=2870838 RepID=UPI001EEBA2CA|nr:histidine kinase [Maribellus maritimus]MCG6191177.1 histidine kinase [Maribellus maritimus]
MKYKNKISIPSKKKLILYSSIAITILFTLPRTLVLLKLGQANIDIQNRLVDYGFRTIYSFLIALIFFTLNLEFRKIKILSLTINLGIFYQRILLNAVLFVLIDVPLVRLHMMLFDPLSFERLFQFVFNLNLILEFIFVILISHIYFLLYKNYLVKIENESLLKANAEARYEALKNQINPHFLFNSFNTINSLILSDQTKATTYVNNMSDVFRYVLESNKKERASVKEEITFIESYIQMLEDRYGDKIKFKINIDEKYLAYLMPSMGLQVVVENAVKHNVISHNRKLEIVIDVQQNNLAITNNLQEKKEKQPSTGTGLYNLNQRCNYLSGRNLEIKRSNNNFTVIIPLISNEDINN